MSVPVAAGARRAATAAADPPDEPLKADARHNLELAKLLWVEANKKAAKPHNPNEEPPESQFEPPQPPEGTGQESTDPGMTTAAGDPRTSPKMGPGATQKVGPVEAPKAVPGNNPQLQPLEDSGTVQPLSPEDTREYLRQADERLRKERQSLLRTLYGRDREGVRDW